jgi:hypothetical protein
MDYMPKYVAYIKSLVPPENLLEFHPRDGWEPLCEFLDKKVPENEAFPCVNQGQNVVKLTEMGIQRKLKSFARPYLMGVGAVATVTISWWLMRLWV